MAFALRVFFLLCGISAMLTGAWSWDYMSKDKCCLEGWTHLNDRCYIVQDEPRIFADAENVCNILGGNLASATTALKNVIIYQLVRAAGLSKAWIGYQDAIENGNFVWTDGDTSTYTNFEGGDPDGNGDCVHISTNGEWFDIDCTIKEEYVCSTPLSCH